MNCKQDHNDNDIRHIFIKKSNEQHKYIKKEKRKNKCKNEIKYLLA